MNLDNKASAEEEVDLFVIRSLSNHDENLKKLVL